ncbi:MAG: hypothetical protein LR011_11515 [Verrucomicrobia bacterium]|nr:hypothetical protein [Verrucomicrobiota bacterium]
MTRIYLLWLAGLGFLGLGIGTLPSQAEIVSEVEWQPLASQVQRVVEAMDYLGMPVADSVRENLQKAFKEPGFDSIRRIQETLDPLCLAHVHINPESRVKVAEGIVPKTLIRNGWRQFLVKVHNQAGVTAPLQVTSPNARQLAGSLESQVSHQWLELGLFDSQPLKKIFRDWRLSTALFSSTPGMRESGRPGWGFMSARGPRTWDSAMRSTYCSGLFLPRR